jgi:acetylglutamate kinase
VPWAVPPSLELSQGLGTTVKEKTDAQVERAASARHKANVTPIDKAEVLLEALPFIRRFAGKVLVIKYGGHAMENGELKDSFAQDVAYLKYVGMRPVIVHGGGPVIDEAVRQAGITPQFVRGMRVTDPATMAIVEQLLVGKINKEIVTLLNRHGATAVGLSGKDGELILARKRKSDVDLGLVGDVVGVNPRVIEANAEFVPVIAPTAADRDGKTYNINADVVAGEIAEALRAEKLILLTDVEGVRGRDGKLVEELSTDDARDLIADGTIAAGMIPKIECCIAALAGGVKQAHVIDGRVRHALLLEVLTNRGVGTEVVRGAAPKTRRRLARA